MSGKEMHIFMKAQWPWTWTGNLLCNALYILYYRCCNQWLLSSQGRHSPLRQRARW